MHNSTKIGRQPPQGARQFITNVGISPSPWQNKGNTGDLQPGDEEKLATLLATAHESLTAQGVNADLKSLTCPGANEEALLTTAEQTAWELFKRDGDPAMQRIARHFRAFKMTHPTRDQS